MLDSVQSTIGAVGRWRRGTLVPVILTRAARMTALLLALAATLFVETAAAQVPEVTFQ